MSNELPLPSGSSSDLPVPGAQTQALEAPPISAPGSVFRRFCYRYGVVGNVFLGVGLLLPPVGIVFGSVLAGAAGAAAGTAVGIGAFWSMMNRVTVYGNARLRAELARRLGIEDPGAEFVGLCLPENNTVQGKLLTMRLETDDNVGFLSLEEDCLSLSLEEGLLRVPRSDIREVTMERFVELPYLRWIVVQYYESGTLRTLLLCSRQCRTLQEARAATEALMARMIDWYTEPVVLRLEQERWASEDTALGRPDDAEAEAERRGDELQGGRFES